MVTKTKKQGEGKGKKGKVKVLNLKKETVKSLSASEARDVKGGAASDPLSTGLIGLKSRVRATSTL